MNCRCPRRAVLGISRPSQDHPMHSPAIQAVCLALTRLRRAVLACCWLAGLALLAQSVVWALAMYTELRWEEPSTSGESTPAVVHRDTMEKTAVQSLRAKDSPLVAPIDAADAGDQAEQTPVRRASRTD